jgi:hypothetical protein
MSQNKTVSGLRSVSVAAELRSSRTGLAGFAAAKLFSQDGQTIAFTGVRRWQ